MSQQRDVLLISIILQSSTGLRNKVSVTQYDKPLDWRITLPTKEDDVLEEVVLRLQGIVCAKMLPPVLLIPR